ncbi:glutathione S-transferase [Dyella sp. SG562]|uniref:glutathione S-transferase family protein n=1 Tax=Dyella sp. SG562 TaxID=2587017 RepID=UPI00141E1F5D|nr:glutathione S-transferase family protein [Dyella sp. SG562]NII72385.1 glutathione S-transferase [Dyella sp. SG562]
MKLLYQTHSPYARKVLVAAHETGLAGQLDVIHHETSPTRRNEAVYAVNPLGKVPVLLLDDGEVLFDSGVICEYLDGLHGGPKLIPMQTAARYGVLRMQALAQGIADAGIAARWDIERRPEALRWPVLVDAYRGKIAATCDYLEREIDEGAVDLGTIALATALSWIEFREVYDFRAGRPRLAAWYERFSSRPSMQATALSGATHD